MLPLAEALAARPTGHLHLEVFWRGDLAEVIDEENVVVNGYKNTHARLLGGDTADHLVTQFAVGTSGLAAVASNSAIAAPFVKAVSLVSFPAPERVQFDFELLAGEANSKAIREFGLLTAAGVLYARRTRLLPLNKTSDISFTGSWIITF